MSKVARIELVEHRKRFNSLRSANERSVVAAYRYGEIVDVLHRSGYTYDELGEDVDRSEHTVKLYASLFRKYDSEQDLLETARSMRTYDVSRLAGKNALVPAHYQFSCMNCGSHEVRRERKKEDQEDETSSSMIGSIPKFQEPTYKIAGT